MKRSDFFNCIIVYNYLLLYLCKIKQKIEYMNQIKELLAKKRVKRTWFAKKMIKISILLTLMSTIVTNQASTPSSRY